MGSARRDAGPKGLAENLASRLRHCRQLAIASAQPVAMVFPTDGNSRGLAQGYYICQGNQNPRRIEAFNFTAEYQGAVAFLGFWPGLSPEAGLALPGSNGSALNPTTWGLANPSDFAIIFLPSGTPVCDRPTSGGALRLLACAGADYNLSNAAGLTTWSLIAANAPYTVVVHATGQVDVVKGVEGAGGGVAVDSGGVSGSISSPVPALAGGNNGPSITSLETFPAPVGTTLPGGIDATVKQGGYLTLRVQATDPDGDALSCEWVETGNNGFFSSSGSIEMEWNGTAYECVWHFRPPPGATDGDTYSLRCTVTDTKGATDTDQIGVAGMVDVLPRGRIVFSGVINGNRDIFSMNSDGTDRIRLTNDPADDFRPVYSGEGDRIAFITNRNGTDELWIMNGDGSDEERLVGTGGPITGIEWAAFHPDGDELAVMARAGASTSIGTVDVSGGGASWILNFPGVGSRGLAWANDDTLIFSGGAIVGAGLGSELHEYHFPTNTDTILTPFDGQGRVEPTVDPNGTRIVYNGDAGSLWEIPYVPGAGAPGTVGVPAPMAGAPIESPQFSPDGSQLYGQVMVGANRDPAVKNADGSIVSLGTTPGEDEDDGNWVEI